MSDKSDWVTPAATLIAALLSFVAGIITASLRRQRKLFAEQEKYKRVTKQLDEFYGPLYALDSAGWRIWERFCKLNHRCSSMGIMEKERMKCFLTHDDDNKQIKIVEKNDPISGQDYDQNTQKPLRIHEQRKFLETYMRVMQHVFKPLNDQREQLVLTKSALIETSDADSRVSGEGNQIPSELIDLVAHVAELRSLLKRWETINLGDDVVRGTLQSPEDQEIFIPSFPYPDGLAKYASTKFAELKKCQKELHDKLVGLR